MNTAPATRTRHGHEEHEEHELVRSDIRPSFGSMSGTTAGIPLTIKLKVTDVGTDRVVMPGAVVYLWHCDREGRYSNDLRGAQVVDANGMVTFKSIFPGCYSGRWPHIHVEVYPSLAEATISANKIATSQLALPVAACNSVYATRGYRASKANLAKTSLSSDQVFRDGYSHLLANTDGSVFDGFVARLTVAVG